MKQPGRFFLILVGVVLFGVHAEAQLLGNYYVGARPGSAPGGADPDFATLSLMQSKLRDTVTGGVVGPTTF